MTVAELQKILDTFPEDAEVWHKDMNFGGRDQPLEEREIRFEEGLNSVLIDSIHFEYVD